MAERSLARRLVLYLLVPTTLVIVAAALVATLTARRSVDALFDDQMRRSAETLLAFLHYELGEERLEGASAGREADESDEEVVDELVEIVADIEARHGVAVNYRLAVGERTVFTSALVRALPACAPGFSEHVVPGGAVGERRWRCYRESRALPDGGPVVTAEFFEPHGQRRDAIGALVLRTFAPIFALPALVLLVALWAVHRALAPLGRIGEELDRRSVHHLQRLPREGRPRELLPVVDSVNELLGGIEAGVAREKRFTDDAAHELRTPITSMKMLEQLLRRDNADPALTPLLDDLRSAIGRGGELIEQLLRLARLQGAPSMELEMVDLGELVRERLGALSPQLVAHRVGVEIDDAGTRLRVRANPPAMSVLLDNLLTNAIKFGAPGGTVRVLVRGRTLRVEDDGPGIAPGERERVFERFHRGACAGRAPGSGLGLSLAKSAADAHGFALRAAAPLVGRGASFVLEV